MRTPCSVIPRRPHAPPLRGGLLVALVGTLLLPACAPRQIILERPPQGYYQTAFPLHDTSPELERAFRSLHRILYTGEYQTYTFPPEAGITEADLTDPTVLTRASERFFETDSKSGTAVVLARSGNRILLVTNDHVVRSPPIRIYHYDEEPGTPRAARRVASVSVRASEWGRLHDHPALGPYQVLARDSIHDIALLELRLPDPETASRFPPMETSLGDPRRLNWGSFVYVLGYPSGYPLVTRAIVSDPNRDGRGGFLTDGLWNEGISGGAILAVRGETGSLEWVGLTRAGAGAWEVRLQPRGNEVIDDDLGILYRGPIYLERTLRLQYGITHSVSMNVMREFLARHRDVLRRRGYDVDRL